MQKDGEEVRKTVLASNAFCAQAIIKSLSTENALLARKDSWWTHRREVALTTAAIVDFSLAYVDNVALHPVAARVSFTVLAIRQDSVSVTK